MSNAPSGTSRPPALPSPPAASADDWRKDRSIHPAPNWETTPSDAQLLQLVQSQFWDDVRRVSLVMSIGTLFVAGVVLGPAVEGGLGTTLVALLGLALLDLVAICLALKNSLRELSRRNCLYSQLWLLVGSFAVGFVMMLWIPIMNPQPRAALGALLFGGCLSLYISWIAIPFLVGRALEVRRGRPLVGFERHQFHFYIQPQLSPVPTKNDGLGRNLRWWLENPALPVGEAIVMFLMLAILTGFLHWFSPSRILIGLPLAWALLHAFELRWRDRKLQRWRR
jgi:hypothetical protein